MSFLWKSTNHFQFMASAVWETLGIIHGFAGSSSDFSQAGGYERWQPLFLSGFETRGLYLPLQVHGREVVDLRDDSAIMSLESARQCGFREGDGLIIRRGGYKERLAFGVRTADCLPVLLCDETSIGLVHAGWRGLACGIIERALELMRPKGRLHAIIGPAAGASSYEVGQEVLDAIGDRAVSRLDGERILLDLQQTARRIVVSAQENALVECAPVCTISDTRFHSFRREGTPVKSNLAFVVV